MKNRTFLEKLIRKIYIFEYIIFDKEYNIDHALVFLKKAKKDFYNCNHHGDCINIPCSCLACEYFYNLEEANNFLIYYRYANKTCNLSKKESYKLAFLCYFYIKDINNCECKGFIRKWSYSSNRVDILQYYNNHKKEEEYLNFDNAFKLFIQIH